MTSLPRSTQRLLPSLCLVFLSWFIPPHLRSESLELNTPQLFENQYFLISAGRNFPTHYSSELFRPSQAHPHVGFAHSLNQSWFLNVQAGFRFIEKTYQNPHTSPAQDKRLAIWSFSQESLKIIRISHPLYLFTGPSFMYLLPTHKAMLPIQRDSAYPIEVGAGWSNWLVWNKKNILSAIKFERWRGTYSHRLHAFQISAVLGVSI